MGIEILKGLTLIKIENQGDILDFHTKDRHFQMYHRQDCCEGVSIEEIHGDLEDLIGNPILQAEEETAHTLDVPRQIADKLLGIERGNDESQTWTFYKLATIKGSVTIRWYGSSNGYYSESVSFEEIK